MSAAEELADPQPIPDEFVDWFVAFLRGGEASNVSQA